MNSIAKKMEVVGTIKGSEQILSDIARQCLDKSNGDRRSAANLLIAIVDKNKSIREALLSPLLEQAAWAAIAHSARQERRPYWNTPNIDNTAGITALAREHAKSLLDYPMFTGKTLGDSTRVEVEEAARIHRSQAETARIRATWFSKIANAMDGATCVKDKLNHELLQQLQQEAQQ